MALIPIGPWKRDSTYRVHPLGLKDSTYRVPLLDSKLVRLRYAWYYRIKSPLGPSSALTALGTQQPSFGTLNAVEPRLTYPNLYIESATALSDISVTSRHFGKGRQNGVCNKLGGLSVMRECEARPQLGGSRGMPPLPPRENLKK